MQFPRGITRFSPPGLGLFMRPPLPSRSTTWGLVLVLVLAIGVIDYFVSIELSLAMIYLIPISLATGWLGRRAGFIMSVASAGTRFAGDEFSVYPRPLPGHVFWNVSATFIIFLFVVWLIDSLIRAHRALEGRIAARTSELADSIADRRRLEMELIEVAARERSAIGRELHDELGQHLVATALAAQVLAQQLGHDRGGKEAHAIVGWLEQAIAKSRKLARGLLLARIDSDRLTIELEELAANASQGGVRCRVTHEGPRVTANPGECAQLFRIAQEAIGNALRHGHARQIDITLATDREATCLIVSDDGSGFQPHETGAGMGLRIMQHRAQIISASLAVLSAPGEGTKIICRLPTTWRTSP